MQDNLKRYDDDMFQNVFPDLCLRAQHQEIPAINFKLAIIISNMSVYFAMLKEHYGEQRCTVLGFTIRHYLSFQYSSKIIDTLDIDEFSMNFVNQLKYDELSSEFATIQMFLEHHTESDPFNTMIYNYLIINLNFIDQSSVFASIDINRFKGVLIGITRKILEYFNTSCLQVHDDVLDDYFLNIDFRGFFLVQVCTEYNFRRYTEYKLLRDDFERSAIRRSKDGKVKSFLLLTCLIYNALFYDCSILEKNCQMNFTIILAWYFIGNKLEIISGVTEYERKNSCPQAPLNNFVHYIMNAQSSLTEHELIAKRKIIEYIKDFRIPDSDFSLEKIAELNKDGLNNVCEVIVESYDKYLAQKHFPSLTDSTFMVQRGKIIYALHRKLYLIEDYQYSICESLRDKLHTKRIWIDYIPGNNVFAKYKTIPVLISHIKSICTNYDNSRRYLSEFWQRIFDGDISQVDNVNRQALAELVYCDIRLQYEIPSILLEINPSPQCQTVQIVTEQKLVEAIFCFECYLANSQDHEKVLQLVLTNFQTDDKVCAVSEPLTLDDKTCVASVTKPSRLYCILNTQSCFARLIECAIAFALFASPLILLWRINLITMISSICASSLSFLVSLTLIIFYTVEKHKISKCNCETCDSVAQQIHQPQKELTNENIKQHKEL